MKMALNTLDEVFVEIVLCSHLNRGGPFHGQEQY